MCNYTYYVNIHIFVYIFTQLKKTVDEDLKNEVEDYPSIINWIYSFRNNFIKVFNNSHDYSSSKTFY